MTPYKITIERLWHYGRHHQFLTPGVYRVPQDVSRETADAAVAAGAATRIEAEQPAGRSPRKGAAPDNKARASAPDNKADVGGAPRRGRRSRAVTDA